MPNSQSFPYKKIKVLMVVTQGEVGGAQKYVYDLATSLNKQRYEVLVLMGWEKPELKSRLETANIRVKLLNHLVRNIRPIEDLLAIFELSSAIKEYAPHILHLNSSKAGVLGSLAGRLAGVKHIIFTAHGFAFLEPQPWLKRGLYFWAEKIASFFREKIICVSEFDRLEAIQSRLCSPEKLVTIHNGIDPLTASSKADSAQEKPLWPGPGKGKIIGTIAHLYETKGLIYLVEASDEIIKSFPDAKFIIIGEGAQRKNLESKIRKLELQNNFFLAGKKARARGYLASFDIFVLPSIKEGFPYSILEAMAAGLPIVSTSVGGIPEAIRNGTDGILVEPRNPKSLAEAIEKVLKSPSLTASLGSNAKARVQNFSLENMFQETEQVYRKLLEG